MSVGLLARILVWTVIKRGNLWVLLLSSCFTFPNTEEAVFGAKTRAVSWRGCCRGPGSAFSHYSRGSQERSTALRVPKQAAVGDVLLCSSCFPELRVYTFSYVGNGILLGGRQGCESLQFFIPWLSVVQQPLCTVHGASRPGQGQCDTTIQVQQALRSEAEKMWPRDRWEKINFEGLGLIFKARRYFKSNDKIHCWKKLHKTWNTKARFKKLFVFSRTICIKIAPLLKKKKSCF